MSNKTYRMLAINIGSTSTKLGYFENEELRAKKVARYDSAYLEKNFATIFDQEDLRMQSIHDFLGEEGIDEASLDAVVTRGAMLNPVPSGCIEVTEKLVADAAVYGGFHPVALGVRLALHFAREAGVPCYTVDPPSTDEMTVVSKLSGFPEIEREVQYQPLNQKKVARTWCAKNGLRYEDANVIVAHMGGGTTIGAHDHGRVVDVNSGNLGEGPMTPERPGSVPLINVIRECYSGTYTQDQMEYRVYHGGGIKAYVGTSDLQKVESKANEGDAACRLVLEAYAYQVAKEIGSLAAVLCGDVDAILLTGGAAYSSLITEYIRERVAKLSASFAIYPGESELEALMEGTLPCLRGEKEPIDYDVLPKRTSVWEAVCNRAV